MRLYFCWLEGVDKPTPPEYRQIIDDAMDAGARVPADFIMAPLERVHMDFNEAEHRDRVLAMLRAKYPQYEFSASEGNGVHVRPDDPGMRGYK